MVDPTGLKPALHGLKGRCSVTRAPGQKIGCGGRTRTFDNRINNPAPYQLGYATGIDSGRQKSNVPLLAHETRVPCWSTPALLPLDLAAATRVELVSSRLQDERSEAN